MRILHTRHPDDARRASNRATRRQRAGNPRTFVRASVSLHRLRDDRGRCFGGRGGNEEGAKGLAVVPKGQEEAVIESAEECPGECIMIEPS